MRRVPVLLAVLAACVVATASVGATMSKPTTTHKTGGIFRIGTDSGLDSINPFVGFNTDVFNTFESIYSHLIVYDAKLAYRGDLATGWKTSKDGRTVTFDIRSGATWSDGQPLDATDVASVMNWAIKLKLPFADDLLGGLQSARAAGANKLTLRYDKPRANILAKLVKWPILPPQVWLKFTSKQAQEYPNTSPVSSGPFIVTKYSKRSLVLTKANPNYYGRKPQVDGWGLKTYQNADAMIQALRTGEIDGVETIPGASFASVKKDKSLNVVAQPSSFMTDFIINSNPNKVTHRELLNPKVRQAFAFAIDKRALINLLFAGQGSPANSIVPPASGNASGTNLPWHDPHLANDRYNPAQANKILDGLGYKRSGSVRVANGSPMSYTMIVPTDAYAGVLRAADLFKRWFSAIGVQLNIKPLDSTAAYNEIVGSSAATKTPQTSYKKFDLALWNWTARPDPDDILQVLTTEQYGAQSDSGYASATYERLYHQQKLTTNVVKRVHIIWKMQELLARDKPYIMLVYADKLQAWNKKWQGLRETPGGFFNELSPDNMINVHQAG